jgi:hypothetical protein
MKIGFAQEGRRVDAEPHDLGLGVVVHRLFGAFPAVLGRVTFQPVRRNQNPIAEFARDLIVPRRWRTASPRAVAAQPPLGELQRRCEVDGGGNVHAFDF